MPYPNNLHAEQALRELHRAVGCAVWCIVSAVVSLGVLGMVVLWVLLRG